jgi:lysophospholipase L1-like esterase
MKKKILIILISLAAAEIAAHMPFALNFRGFETTRRILLGDVTPLQKLSFQRCIGQPYLLYIPAPSFIDENGVQHNTQGFRGPAVSRLPEQGVLRILCLGGSTTYGWMSPRSDQTYPAYLEEILNQAKPKGVRRVEVINGGIPSGTTAELLTHYHFKFHYFHPQIVVINPGGNDLRALVMPYYHPDYSNTRHEIHLPDPFPPAGRMLLHSRMVALLLIPLTQGPYPNANAFYDYKGLPPPARWYDDPNPIDWKKRLRDIPKEDVAFQHNLESLIHEIRTDKAKVLLVPFRSSPVIPYQPVEGLAYEEQMLKDIAQREGISVAPFPSSVISRENWLDDCHTNAAGNRQKADHIAPYIRALFSTPTPH